MYGGLGVYLRQIKQYYRCVDEIIFHNDKSGFTVFDAEVNNERFVLSEKLGVNIEEFYATGDYVEHPAMGCNFGCLR
jgi:hypothetical protein